ncbi:related to Alcohol dehydrogenase [Phialocephala subalpina]|uniref:Related to Alcohol dehydrogenase n=1 Tax=Phialocephala subalpina TaxID=576137 RepID=A0A1L7XKJ8_9HELO|nr:related to Alcohol dehydrogenase [Phialocephala subalpina]
MPLAWQIRSAPPKDYRTEIGIENLYLATDLPMPVPEANTTLVRIRAVALNARDMMIVAHDPLFPIEAIPDLVLCADGAGVVEAVGEGSVWNVGDKVILNPAQWIDGEVPDLEGMKVLGGGGIHGTLREYAVMFDSRFIHAPPHLSYEELVALPVAASTAMNALFFGPLPLKKGMTVLIQGTGGVSCFLIQLAAATGATVMSTSSSEDKLSQAASLGATHLVNYKTIPNWSSEVLRLTSGRGVDHVFDVGGSGSIEQSLAATRQGGLVSMIGFMDLGEKTDVAPAIVLGAKTVRGVFGYSRDMVVAMTELMGGKGLRPLISKVFEFEEAKEAFKALVKQNDVGKIVIRVGSE